MQNSCNPVKIKHNWCTLHIKLTEMEFAANCGWSCHSVTFPKKLAVLYTDFTTDKVNCSLALPLTIKGSTNLKKHLLLIPHTLCKPLICWIPSQSYLRSSALGIGLVHRWLLYLATYSHCLNGAVLSSRTWRMQKAYPFNLRCLQSLGL